MSASREEQAGERGRGESGLERLLETLEPRLDPEPFEFVRVERLDRDLGRGSEVRGLFREAEGWTAVLPSRLARGLRRPAGDLWARIELTVYSDLAAVGLMAVVTARLAAEGIGVNPWAAWHHDHLFVPWERRTDALEVLTGVQRAAVERARRRAAWPGVEIDCGLCRLRPFRPADEGELATIADDAEVARWLRDRFPHPYTRQHARAWIALATAEEPPPKSLAIETDGRLAGGIGLVLGEDIARRSAEVGYWLGRAWWGRGIATAALDGFVRWAMPTFGLTRVFASAFADNAASRRVLEKAGFRLEGILRRAAFKGGRVIDDALYARTDEDLAAPG